MNTIVKCGYRPVFPSIFAEIYETAAKNRGESYYKPAANIIEEDGSFSIELALPGFDKEEISMKLEKNILMISAGHEKSEIDKEIEYSTREFGITGLYRRSFIIPETVNTELISAEYRNGVLIIALPNKDPKPFINKEIPIV